METHNFPDQKRESFSKGIWGVLFGYKFGFSTVKFLKNDKKVQIIGKSIFLFYEFVKANTVYTCKWLSCSTGTTFSQLTGVFSQNFCIHLNSCPTMYIFTYLKGRLEFVFDIMCSISQFSSSTYSDFEIFHFRLCIQHRW